ncbi:Biopolymer transport protein ExbD/TolR [plant metagenome]|uniref:Biopolymer transport protein ExbD/TolR n=1 Tax=plant metagenome TaxID=1297885 RepID=A0A484S6D8_9ZZZZ
MNFGGPRAGHEELEINLIPLIDVLLVILIFLAATTSFMRQSALEVALPRAQADAASPPQALDIAISRDGRYALNGELLEAAGAAAIAQALARAAAGQADAVLVINADGQASHQSVVDVMEAAREAGIARVNFAAQRAP